MAEPVAMERIHLYRPRVSRETRLLLTTALIAIAALWVLARVRFPDRPPPQNPVQPLLTQLTPRPTFDDLASEIAALRPRLESLLVNPPSRQPGLRVRDDVAAVWLDPRPERPTGTGDSPFAHDPASGLSLVRIAPRSGPAPMLWSSPAGGPRYFIASEMSPAGLSLRPVYVALLVPVDSPRWPGQEWQLPAGANVAAGSFLFTADAAVAGLVVDYGAGRALVPAATVLAEAERLLDRPLAGRASVGIDVQPLTASLVKATGATAGVIVTWVDPDGPAAGSVDAGDVIETANGVALATVDHWDVQVARLAAGQMLTIGVYAAGGRREVTLEASPVPAPDPQSLGLALRTLPGIGAEVARVDAGSSGDRGGLRVGDVVTRVDSTAAPTPAQVRRAFASVGERPLIVAFTRGASRQITALEK
jgi:hypothetical protein